MKTIEMTAEGRLGTLMLLGQQQGSFQVQAILFDIREKIKFAPEVEATLYRDAGNGQTQINLAALGTIEPEEIELENAEADKLREVFENHQTFQVNDVQWVRPIMKALTA